MCSIHEKSEHPCCSRFPRLDSARICCKEGLIVALQSTLVFDPLARDQSDRRVQRSIESQSHRGPVSNAYRMASRQKTRFLIISDTHNQDFTFDGEVDVVLHCGDITECGGLENHRKAIQNLGALKAELKLVIAGNHDLDLDPAQNLGEEHETATSLWKGEDAQRAGIHYLDEGVHAFDVKRTNATLTVYASPYSVQYGVSAFQYPSHEDRYNPSKKLPPGATPIPAYPAIDIVMTHGPPQHILDRPPESVIAASAGCPHLRRAITRAKPLLHAFGHIHTGYGARRVAWKGSGDPEGEMVSETYGDTQDDDVIFLTEEFISKGAMKKKGYAEIGRPSAQALGKGRQTLFVNAALAREEGEGLRAPWLVELELGKVSQRSGAESIASEGKRKREG
ncbi:hypothetical protein MRB53_037668 [Persea americana]|nr:hypothetical protein MRB53_037668 [Persea americana]